MIDKINLQPLKMTSIAAPKTTTPAEVSDQFGQYLNNAINELNGQLNQVDKLNEQFIRGELSDVHQLTIASEKASLGLGLTVQVRNKIIEAYQEIMRTQV